MNTTSVSRALSVRTSDRLIRSGLTAVVLLAVGGTAAAASAEAERRREEKSDHEYAHRLHEQGTIVSLESVVARAQTIRAGDLLEAELKTKKGFVYEVEILDEEGQVWELKFDAKNGQLIKEEQEKH